LILFIGVPIVAVIVWLIRRIAGAKSRNHYIGYTFGALWIVGLFCFIALGIAIKRNFDYRRWVRNDFNITQPATGKIVVRVANSTVRYYGGWWGGNWNNGPFNFADDSLVVKSVQVKIERSKDSTYHVFSTKFSNGSSSSQAETFARQLGFQVNQQDSILYLDNGFSLPAGQKFRNQQVLVTIQVPVGKRVLVDRSVNHRYHWFRIDNGDWDWDDDNEPSYSYDNGVEYIMTAGGLERTDGKDKHRTRRVFRHGRWQNVDDYDDNNDNDNNGNNDNNSNKRTYQYRYKELKDSLGEKAKDRLREEMRVKDSLEREKKLKEVIKTSSVSTRKTSARTNADDDDLPGNHLILSPVLIFARP
ncbi:MAG TPA: hypothetical protein VLD19_08960, partial [Chitinophagaceae bacterium]|nr:hypothetical protein [Chitinophagaceae bacterium]